MTYCTELMTYLTIKFDISVVNERNLYLKKNLNYCCCLFLYPYSSSVWPNHQYCTLPLTACNDQKLYHYLIVWYCDTGSRYENNSNDDWIVSFSTIVLFDTVRCIYYSVNRSPWSRHIWQIWRRHWRHSWRKEKSCNLKPR